MLLVWMICALTPLLSIVTCWPASRPDTVKFTVKVIGEQAMLTLVTLAVTWAVVPFVTVQASLDLLRRREMPEFRRMHTRNLQARTDLRKTSAKLVKHTLAAAVEIDGNALQGSCLADLKGHGGPVDTVVQFRSV